MLDCLIVGAGPAGLTAALYLRRFHRAIGVLNDGDPRAMRIGRSFNVPGFPDGVGGRELLARLTEQFTNFGGAIVSERATSITPAPEGGFIVKTPTREWPARTVLLATGAKDHQAGVCGIDAVRDSGLLRECPICDGHEFRDRRIVVMGHAAHAVKEALFLRHYSDRIHLVSVNAGESPGADWQAPLSQRDIPWRGSGIRELAQGPEGLAVHLNDGQQLVCDVLYSGLGCSPGSELGHALGAECDEAGNLIVDAHCRTRVPGLYAAGDVTPGLDQIAVAMGQGATAATAIHNSL